MQSDDIKRFFELVTPGKGTYYWVWSKDPTTEVNRQKHCSSRDELRQLATKALDQHRDTYYAYASFNAPQRLSQHVEYLRGFVVDIDCRRPDKNSKDHLIIKDVKKQVNDAVEAGKLPKSSALVHSGYGLHYYYCTPEDITKSQWQPVANLIPDAFKALGIEIDAGVGKKAAGIIRYPDGWNYRDPESPVKVWIEELTPGAVKSLEDYHRIFSTTAGKAQLTVVSGLPATVDNSDLSGGLYKDLPPPPAAGILEQCEIFKEAYETGGEEFPGEVWFRQLNVLSFCADGYNYIDTISDQHPKYSPEKNEERWQYALDQKDQGLKPTTCNEFSRHSNLCQKCPHFGKIKSPIKLAYKHAPPAPLPSDPETRYLNPEKTIWVSEEMTLVQLPKMDKPETLFGFEALKGELLRDRRTMRVEYIHPATKVRGEFLYTSSTTSQECVRNLLDGCCPASGSPLKSRFHAMESWLSELARATKPDGIINDNNNGLGWHGDYFRLGKRRIIKTNDAVEVVGGNLVGRHIRHFEDNYTPTGTIEAWREGYDLILSKDSRAEAHILLATAFAGPLIGFAGDGSSLTLSVFNPHTGQGKTTLLKLAAATWSNPTFMLKMTDTDAAITERMGRVGDLPMYMDDFQLNSASGRFIQAQNGQRVRDIIQRVSGGATKTVSSRASAYTETRRWNTLLTITSNHSLINTMQSGDSAAAARLMEYQMPKLDEKLCYTMRPVLNNIEAKLTNNFGNAGVVYAEELVRLGPNMLRKLVIKAEEVLYSKVNWHPQMRMKIPAMAAILTGAQIANKIGLAKFNIGMMFKWAIAMLHRDGKIDYTSDEYVAEQFQDYVADYLNSNLDKVCRSPKYEGGTRSSRFTSASDTIGWSEQDGEPIARVSSQDKKIILNRRIFLEWIASNVTSREYVTNLDMIAQKYGVCGKTHPWKNLCLTRSSTSKYNPQVKCVMFDCLDTSGDAERTAWLAKLADRCF